MKIPKLENFPLKNTNQLQLTIKVKSSNLQFNSLFCCVEKD